MNRSGECEQGLLQLASLFSLDPNFCSVQYLAPLLAKYGFVFVEPELVRSMREDRDRHRICRTKELLGQGAAEPISAAEARLMVDFGNETLANSVLAQNPFHVGAR